MSAKTILTAAEYHRLTAYQRDVLKGRMLDWRNQPDLYKTYSYGKTLPLSDFEPVKPRNLWELVSAENIPLQKHQGINQNLLSSIFALSYGITAEQKAASQTFYYRSAASAGALYPVEIYLGVNESEDLSAGLYHYNIKNFKLTALREGVFKQQMDAFGGKKVTKDFAVTFFITAILFRSSWKYGARAYRYVLLDAGHVIENLLLTLRTTGLPYECFYDFRDSHMERFIGLDRRYEVCLAGIHAGSSSKKTTDRSKADAAGIPKLHETVIAASQVSGKTVFYEEIERIHQAGRQWSPAHPPSPIPADQTGNASRVSYPIDDSGIKPSSLHFVEALFKRRSRRNFIQQELPKTDLMHLLQSLCQPSSQHADFMEPAHSGMIIGFLSGAIEDIDPGFYLLDTGKMTFSLIRKGRFIEPMTRACLDQEWLKNAALHFAFLADLDAIDAAYGSRGYRYTLLKAGRLGQRLYLGASTLGLGCCGIGAYYDNEAIKIMKMAHSYALVYLVAVGPVKRR
jgi:SagB-type dehydrogenase family enzyme